MQGVSLLLIEQPTGDHPEGGAARHLLLHPPHLGQDQDQSRCHQPAFQHLPANPVCTNATLFNTNQSKSVAIFLEVLVPLWKIASLFARIHQVLLDFSSDQLAIFLIVYGGLQVCQYQIFWLLLQWILSFFSFYFFPCPCLLLHFVQHSVHGLCIVKIWNQNIG